MRITKDEARILAAALEGQKYDLAQLVGRTKMETIIAIEGLETLEMKLEAIGKDARRKGRKKQDGIREVLERFLKG